MLNAIKKIPLWLILLWMCDGEETARDVSELPGPPASLCLAAPASGKGVRGWRGQWLV